jgi:hypothetical protein
MNDDRAYKTWDNNPKEDNLEDGAIDLECLEEKKIASGPKTLIVLRIRMSPPSSAIVDRIPTTSTLASLPPQLCGGFVAYGGAHPSVLIPTSTVRSQEKILDVVC